MNGAVKMLQDKRVSRIMSGKCLFVFAHPDDDSFISGTIARLLSDGVEVHCVWLTSGGYMGGSVKREKELFAAAEILGLKRSRINLLRLPDLGLIHNLKRAVELLAGICRAVNPQIVYVTAFEGGHPDHDCANFVVYESRKITGLNFDIMEYPLYNGSGSLLTWRWRINAFPNEDGSITRLPLTSQEVALKHRIMQTYSSQWMYMIPARLASSEKKMLKSGEPQRLCPEQRDHTIKPHSGKMNYERWFNAFMRIRFSDFRDAVERLTCYR